jgi:Asp-tRNA(Asn)/Glu-tRNA(Gln) amidotransferase A subunit family amidase
VLVAGLPLTARDVVRGEQEAMLRDDLELLEATIPELQAALTTGATTSQALVEQYLARIAAYDQQGPALNAISAVNSEALAEAAALDRERQEQGPRGPLHGIPVLVKDNFETTTMPTAAGSLLLKDWVAPADAFLVQQLRAAGAIILAKTNMHEWAWSWETYGSLFGQTRNPYALDRVPGGSSGGTGAALAATFAAVGLGSDTCGSVRVPAAHNSLVGLRPTQGLLSRTGIIPLSSTQDTAGPLARSVTDLAIVLDALVGYDPADPPTAESLGHLPRRYTDFLQLDGLRGARIGLLTSSLGTEPEEAEVTAVMQAAAAELRAAGAEVVEVEIAGLAELLASTYSGVIREDFKADLNAYLASRPTAPVQNLAAIIASGVFHPGVERILRLTEEVETRDTKEYYEKLARRTLVRQAALTAMAEHGVATLAYPTVRRPAVRIGDGTQMGVNCQLSAHSGLPAITVPAGFTGEGLPVGLELLGGMWTDGELIRLAYAYEQATRHRQSPASTPALAQD